MYRRTSPNDTAAALLTGLVVVAVILALAILWRTLVEVIRIYRAAAPGSQTARDLWRALGALGCAWAGAALLTIGGWTEAAGLLAGWSFLAYTVFVTARDTRDQTHAREHTRTTGRLEEVLRWPVPLPPIHANGVHP